MLPLVVVLRRVWPLALARAAAAAAAGAASGGLAAAEHGRAGGRAVPQWRIDQVLRESGPPAPDFPAALQLRATAPDAPNASAAATAAAAGEPGEASENVTTPRSGSTAAQDRGACPLVKLPAKLHMMATESTWAGQGGTWQSNTGVVHSSFRLSFISTTWDTAYNRNLDEQAAFRGEVTSDEELEYSYEWKLRKGPMDYPAIAKLENDWWSAVYKGAHSVLKSPEEKYGKAGDDQASTWRTTALVDCEGHLLYVVKLLQQEAEKLLPGGIDVYDRGGTLVAHAMVDYSIARYQFVDVNGNLIATAEAPGVGLAIPLKDLEPDPYKGLILPYGVEFQKGGYTDASRLLDTDYRWVIAAAVQARALDDAHRSFQPWAPWLLVAAGVLFGALLLVLICFACGAMYRLVYPRGHSEALPPLWDKKTQPQFYSMPYKAA
ncbi:unnamed protein product [Prorocentrum cordatum]|uniref:Uncharacterized protein n=1 Tax=Prorocentrum cordatum TaxID=2364126 RepID=A0ABN9WLN5_9DINO|nr:unnamed protein product [Polarella glacialis]